MKYKKILFLLVLCVGYMHSSAQKVEEIYFNLYTDSLKRGTFNYINVDAKLSNGRWIPLTDKDLHFKTNIGHFKANSLWLDDTVSIEKVSIAVLLKADTSLNKSIDIYIKKSSDWGKVVSPEEIITPSKPNRRKRN